MTRADFLAALEHELRLRHVPFAQRDLIAFAEAAGPVEDEPVDVGRWTEEFMRPQVNGLVDCIGVLPADVAAIDAGE